MGMYTEFFFRAHLKKETPEPLLAWLADFDDPDGTLTWEEETRGYKPFDDHPLFRDPDWYWLFIGSGAVYQIARGTTLRRAAESYEPTELVIMTSAKSGRAPVAEFVDWISPHLAHVPGDFLGYTLYEDSRPSGWDEDSMPDQERPHLIFMAKPGSDHE